MSDTTEQIMDSGPDSGEPTAAELAEAAELTGIELPADPAETPETPEAEAETPEAPETPEAAEPAARTPDPAVRQRDGILADLRAERARNRELQDRLAAIEQQQQQRALGDEPQDPLAALDDDEVPTKAQIQAHDRYVREHAAWEQRKAQHETAAAQGRFVQEAAAIGRRVYKDFDAVLDAGVGRLSEADRAAIAAEPTAAGAAAEAYARCKALAAVKAPAGRAPANRPGVLTPGGPRAAAPRVHDPKALAQAIIQRGDVEAIQRMDSKQLDAFVRELPDADFVLE